MTNPPLSRWAKRALAKRAKPPAPVYRRQERPQAPEGATTEAQRVVMVPERIYDGADLTQALRRPGRKLPFADPSGAMIQALQPDQSAALEAIRDGSGGLIIVGVGGGKAGVALLAGAMIPGIECVIVLTPATTVPQLSMTLATWRQHMLVCEHTRILSYHALSNPRPESMPPLLEELTAGFEDNQVLIVADECHRLKNPGASRTKRVGRYFEGHSEAHFVGLSGTITRKSLKDFGHLAEWALRDLSPLPRDAQTLDAWAECLDVRGKPGTVHWRKLEPLLDRYRVNQHLPTKALVHAAREAFQRRLQTAPGVHTSRRTSVDCSLIIHSLKLDVPKGIRELLEDMAEMDCDADGVPFASDADRWRTAREVSMGFFYRRVWPLGCYRCGASLPHWKAGAPCERGGTHLDSPEPIPDDAWMSARSGWNSAVRVELENNSRHGYDSPRLVQDRAQAAWESAQAGGGTLGVPDRLVGAWVAWDAQRGKRWGGKPEPPTVGIWEDYFLIEHAVDWVKHHRIPTIIWYESKAVAEALRRAGVTVYGAGDSPPAKRAHNCAMSIRAQGEGLNLQKWHSNLVIEPPSGGASWEQFVGRTHRNGQTADEVDAYVYQHTLAFRDAVRNARKSARYIETTTGNQQRLGMADYHGFPLG